MWDYLKPPTQLQMERIELILERINEVTTQKHEIFQQLKITERKIDNLQQMEVKENMRKASIAEILLVTEN